MHTVKIDDTTLAYSDEGNGPPVVFVHAFPLSSAMWQPQLDALKNQFRLIAPDLRGFGESELGTPPASLERYAADLAAILDYLEIEQAAVVGLSMGGYIALAMLNNFRNRISALVLADTRAGADTAEARDARLKNAQLAERDGALAVGEPMLARLLAASAPDTIRDEVRSIIAANSGDAVAAALRSMAARPDSTAALTQITVPTLVIVGSEDALTPPAEARILHAGIQHSQFIEIPGVGHLANLEAPEQFSEAIRAFLGTD